MPRPMVQSRAVSFFFSNSSLVFGFLWACFFNVVISLRIFFFFGFVFVFVFVRVYTEAFEILGLFLTTCMDQGRFQTNGVW
jgi:hypothetical protein